MLITDPKNESSRFFGHTKSNLTKLGSTLHFELSDNLRLVRIEDKLLSQLFATEGNESTVEEAGALAREILSNRPTLRDSLFKELDAAGFTDATIRRALKSIGVVRKRVGFAGQPKGSGAWLICTEAQRQALDGLKFEHVEQLNGWLSTYTDQGAQISYSETMDEEE